MGCLGRTSRRLRVLGLESGCCDDDDNDDGDGAKEKGRYWCCRSFWH